MARRPGVREVPLASVASLVAKARQDQRDLYVPLSDIRVDLGRSSPAPLAERFQLHIPDHGSVRSFRLADTAVKQLCTHSGVPAPFLEKVPPSLGLKLVRCMLELASEVDDRPLLFRTQGRQRPVVRAVLPQSFVRFDDLQVVDAVRSLVADEDARASWVAIDQDTLFIRLLFAGVDLGTHGRPDPGQVGVDIINSETGTQATSLRTLVLRQVCTNGMTAVSAGQSILRQRHTGLEPQAFATAVEQAIEESFSVGRQMAKRLTEARGEYVADPAAELAAVFRRYNLGSPRGKLGRWVAAELARDASPLFGVQRWHICQALTAVARGLEHSDRMRLEDAAAAYLTGKGEVENASTPGED